MHAAAVPGLSPRIRELRSILPPRQSVLCRHTLSRSSAVADGAMKLLFIREPRPEEVELLGGHDGFFNFLRSRFTC